MTISKPCEFDTTNSCSLLPTDKTPNFRWHKSMLSVIIHPSGNHTSAGIRRATFVVPSHFGSALVLQWVFVSAAVQVLILIFVWCWAPNAVYLVQSSSWTNTSHTGAKNKEIWVYRRGTFSEISEAREQWHPASTLVPEVTMSDWAQWPRAWLRRKEWDIHPVVEK